MVHYRRARIAGGTYFFTVALRDRRADTLVRHVGLLRQALRCVQTARPWRTDAMVVMPDHLHALWTLPDLDSDYAGRWRAVKSRFVRSLRQAGVGVRSNAKGEADVWQRRFWEHLIRDEEDFARHVEYIHFNPVKHGHVAHVADWRWSTFHRYVRQGWLSRDWASSGIEGSFGE